MKKFLQKKLKDQKGMTLIELLAVIVILAIIAAIAIPAIGNIIENSRYSAVKSDATNALNAATLYYTDNPDEPTGVELSKLVSDGYMENPGSLPADSAFTLATPRAFTSTTAVKYSGEKTVTFTGATVAGINEDTNRGSGDGGYTIGKGANE